jgi:hypothetical protein
MHAYLYYVSWRLFLLLDDISKKKNVIDHSKFTNNWELNNLNRLC